MLELENVPRGHGNILAKLELLPGICLNPEATRAATMISPGFHMGYVTLIASVAESIGLLEENNSCGIYH